MHLLSKIFYFSCQTGNLVVKITCPVNTLKSALDASQTRIVHQDDLTTNMKHEVHQLPPDTLYREQISDLLKAALVNDTKCQI